MAFLVTSPDGRKLRFEGDEPPPIDVVEEAFRAIDNPEILEQSRLKSAGQGFMQGGAKGIGQTVSGVARTMEAVDDQPYVPTTFAPIFKPKKDVRPPRTAEQREADLQENPIYKVGQSITEGAKEAFPTNPKYGGEFFTDVLPQAAGGLVPTVAAGIVNPALGAIQYGASAGQAGAEESIAMGDLEDADRVFLLNAGIGAASEFALGVPVRVLSYFRKARVAGLSPKDAGKEWLKFMGVASARESTQEGIEQVGNNLVAQGTYDPERGTFEGVPESMAAGAILGPVVGGGAYGIGKLAYPEQQAGAVQPPEQSTEVPLKDNATIQPAEKLTNFEGLPDQLNEAFASTPEQPPATPALSIEGLPPTMETARRIVQMSPEELLASIRSFNDINKEIGRRATPEQVNELRNLKAYAEQRALQAREKVAQTLDQNDMQAMVTLNMLPQFFNEAINASTGQDTIDIPKQPTTVPPNESDQIPPVDQGTVPQQAATETAPDSGAEAEVARLSQVWKSYKPDFSGQLKPAAVTDVGFARSSQEKGSSPLLTREAKDALESALGKQIVIVQSSERLGWNGLTLSDKPNVLFVNSDTPIAPFVVIGHEVVESIKFGNEAEYNQLRDALLPYLQNVPEYKARLETAAKAEGVTDIVQLDATKEIIGDFVGNSFGKPKFWDDLAATNPNVFQRVAQIMVNLIRRVLDSLYVFNSNQHISDLEKAHRVVVDAINKHAARMRTEWAAQANPQVGLSIRTEPTARAWDRITEQPGLDPAARERLMQLRGVQSGDINPDLRERIAIAAFTEPANRAERVTRTLIKRTAELVTVSQAPLDFNQIADPNARQEAAGIVTERHILLGNERAKIEAHAAKAEAAMLAFAKTLDKQVELKNVSDFLSAKIPAEIRDYETYLNNLAKLGPNQSIQTAAQMMLQKAANSVGKKLVHDGAVASAIRALALNTNIVIDEDTTTRDVLNQFWQQGGKTNVNPELTLLLFGEPSGSVVAGIDPLLSRIKNLPQIIDGLRVLESRRDKAAKEVREFQQAFNQSGKAVGVGTAMKRFAAHVMAKRDADAYLRAASNEYEKLRASVIGGNTAFNLVNELLEAPAYKQAVEEAARTINLDITGLIVSVDGRHETSGPYPENKRNFIFTLEPTLEAQKANRDEALSLLTEIDRFINDPASDPLKRVSWENIGKRINAVWLQNNANPLVEREKGYRDPFDLKHWVGLWHSRTLQGLFRDQIAGPETLQLLKNLDALDATMLKMRALETNPEYGRRAITNAIVAGALSHGIELRSEAKKRIVGKGVDTAIQVEQYRRTIMNPIAASLQHHGAMPLRVGDYIPGTAIRVTKEDVAAVEKLHKFEQAVRAVSEEDLKVYGAPTKIADKLGKTAVTRTSIATGPKMLTRYWSDDISGWVGRNWMSRAVGETRETQIDKLRRDMWENPEVFNDVVLSYITTTNPEFVKRSEFAGDFRKLTEQMRTTPTTISSLDDIVDAIAPMRPKMSREELRAALKKSLESEAVRIMDAMVKEVGQDLDAKDNNIIDNAVYSSLRTEGSFLKPRGAMLGPDSFYQYAKAADVDILRGPAVAVTIGRARAVESMREVQAGYYKHLDRIQNEIKQAMADKTAPQTRSQKIRQYDQDAKLGKNRFTWSVLRRRIKQIDSEIKKAETNLTGFDETFPPDVARTLTTLNRGFALQVLGGINSITANLFGGTITNAVVVNTLLRKTASTMASPFRVTGKGMKVALAKTITEMGRRNPRLASLAKAAIPFSDSIATGLARNMESTKKLIENSQIADFDWANKRKARKAVGFGGEVLKPEAEVPAHLRGMQWLYTTAPGMFQERFFPRGVDKLMNEINAHLFLDQVKDIASRAPDIGDVRVANGQALNPADPKQFISHEEMEMGVNELMELRKLLAPVGSLEELVFDYYNRYTAAKKAGQPHTLDDVPFAPADKMSAILLSYAKLGNVLAESNTPAFFRGNWIKRIFGTFGNWPSNFADQIAKLFPTSLPRSQTERQKLMKFLLAAVMIVATSIIFKEFKNWLQYVLTGKEPGQASLANISEDPFSVEGAQYLVSTLAQGIPYLNIAVNSASDTGSMFDISKSVLLASMVKDTAALSITAARTGDVSKAFGDFSTRYLPLYSMAINRLPGFNEQVALQNATRALRAATPSSIGTKSYSGKFGRPTPLWRYLRAAETGAMAGNRRKVSSALEAAIAYHTRKGLSRNEATSAVRRSLAGRTPEGKVFGRRLDHTQRAEILGRMTAGQLRSLQRGEEAHRQLLATARTPHRAMRLRALQGIPTSQTPRLRALR